MTSGGRSVGLLSVFSVLTVGWNDRSSPSNEDTRSTATIDRWLAWPQLSFQRGLQEHGHDGEFLHLTAGMGLSGPGEMRALVMES